MIKQILLAVKIRLKIVKSLIQFEAQNELAYKGTNVANAASTLFYTVIYLLFIEVIFSNTDSVGPYGRNEMMFFYFIGQILVFITFSFNNSANRLIDDIRNGSLDFVFLRPVPSLLYSSVQKFNIVGFIRDGLPPLTIIALVIQWNELGITSGSLLPGIFIMFMGIYIVFNIHMIAAMSTFWFGQGKGVYGLTNEFAFDANAIVPVDTMPQVLQNVFIRIVPIVFATGVSTAVMLGNIEWRTVITFGIVSLVYLEAMKQLLWKAAMRRYTSASS